MNRKETGGIKMKPKPVIIKMQLAIDKVPSHEFIQSVRDFFEVLEDVADSLYGTRKAIPWSVKIERGSNVLVAIAGEPSNPEVSPKVVSSAVKKGLKLIRGGARPENFLDKTLERIKSLADLSEDRGLNISIVADRSKQKISSKIRESLSNILRLAYSEVGTIEGHLRILAKRTGRLEVEVRDEISGHLVHCTISPSQLEDAKDAFDRRVSVTGLIHYRADGTPVNIDVRNIFRFPFPRELPRHEEIRGIFREN
jgi:hypothetical protein